MLYPVKTKLIRNRGLGMSVVPYPSGSRPVIGWQQNTIQPNPQAVRGGYALAVSNVTGPAAVFNRPEHGPQYSTPGIRLTPQPVVQPPVIQIMKPQATQTHVSPPVQVLPPPQVVETPTVVVSKPVQPPAQVVTQTPVEPPPQITQQSAPQTSVVAPAAVSQVESKTPTMIGIGAAAILAALLFQ